MTDQQITKLFGKALRKYGLVVDGDYILAGLSGGKDSMALLRLLALRSRIFKPRFRVEAAFVRMTNIPYQNDETYLRAFAESSGVKLHIVETAFNEATDHRHTHCFLCSWQRRKALFNLAQELGCNKIALGHNKDDLMQTALMNMTFTGRFETMPPLLQMKRFPIAIIRPLCLVREANIEEYALRHEFRKQVKNCPYEDASHRHDMKAVIEQLERMNPEFSYSLFHALHL
jgi:tRNA(Ile)-lysidine synthase TilS/MesJ